jgi:hypothetical protein
MQGVPAATAGGGLRRRWQARYDDMIVRRRQRMVSRTFEPWQSHLIKIASFPLCLGLGLGFASVLYFDLMQFDLHYAFTLGFRNL